MERPQTNRAGASDRCGQLKAWFNTDLGIQVLETERSILDELLADIFGYHLLQLSITSEPLHRHSSVGHKVRMAWRTEDEAPLIGDFRELPFANDSLDVVLLQHVLDICEAPTQVLREASRVTIPSGYLVIVGFNPLSLWGLWKLLRFWDRGTPFNGAYLRAGRLMDWLTLLDFRIDRALFGYYRLPINRLAAVSSPDFSQGLSRRLNWPFGAVYVIAARKQVAGMTPLRPVWKNQTTPIGKLPAVNGARRHIAARKHGGEPLA